MMSRLLGTAVDLGRNGCKAVQQQQPEVAAWVLIFVKEAGAISGAMQHVMCVEHQITAADSYITYFVSCTA